MILSLYNNMKLTAEDFIARGEGGFYAIPEHIVIKCLDNQDKLERLEKLAQDRLEVLIEFKEECNRLKESMNGG